MEKFDSQSDLATWPACIAANWVANCRQQNGRLKAHTRGKTFKDNSKWEVKSQNLAQPVELGWICVVIHDKQPAWRKMIRQTRYCLLR